MECSPLSSRSPLIMATLAAGLLALGGCQKPTPAEAAAIEAVDRQQVDQGFIEAFSQVLYRNALGANQQGLIGAVDMHMTLNAQNRVLACTARPSTHYLIADKRSDAGLLKLATELCWNTLLPGVSPQVFKDADDTQVIVAPLVFPSLDALSIEQKQRQAVRVSLYQQMRFLREQLVARQSVEGVGVASFRYVANAQGQVQECQVRLEPSPYRPGEFKPDSALQQRLASQCQQLDLRQMPGFATGPEGLAQGFVSVDYSPWMNGARAN